MHHTSKYSGIGQDTNPDTAALEAAFTALIGDYVDRNVSESCPRPSAESGNRGVFPTAAVIATAAIRKPVIAISAADCNKTIRADIELARIALGLSLAVLFRLWMILRQLSTDTGEQGHSRADLEAALTSYGVSQVHVYTTRLLKRGNGVFWNLHSGIVYPVGYVELCRRLVTEAARRGLHDLYATNHPGMLRPMYLACAGSNLDFEAAILNAWYAAKNNPTISRFTLTRLFNRSELTLRQLETRAGIEPHSNFVETTDTAAVPLKADGELRSDVWRTKDAQHRTVYHFRLPNTYISTRCKQHCHKGQGRKAYFLFKLLIESDELPGMSAAGAYSPGELNPLRLIYCANENDAKRSRRQGNDGTMFVPDRPGEGDSIVWSVYRH